MHCTKLKTYMETGRVIFLPPSRITPNPAQPRVNFTPENLAELAASIRTHGILQPLSVRKTDTHYQLIAGERRYRAAQLAGLRELPCIVMQMTDQESGLVALMENLQRQDLSYIEEAQAYSQLMSRYCLSQSQIAEAVGKSQSAVSNTLRLLRHSQPVLEKLQEHNLSQRQARALLKLPTEEQKLTAIAHIARNRLSTAQTDQYIERLLPSPSPTATERAPHPKPSPGERGDREAVGEEWRQDRPGSMSDKPSHPSDLLPHSSSVTFGDSARLRASPVGGSDSPPDCHSLPPTALRLPSSEGALETQKFLATIHQLIRQSPLPITLTREETPTHTVLTLQIPK